MTAKPSPPRDILIQNFRDVAAYYAPQSLDVLLQSYAQPHRFYHDEKHIAGMLQLLAHYKSCAVRPDIIQQAILWHDVVYQTQQPDGAYRPDHMNVVDSVKDFETLSVAMPQNDRTAIAAMMMATDGHQPPDLITENNLYAGFAADTRLFLDFDLHGFAKPWPEFLTDTQNIRQEFAWVPTEMFCQARADTLDDFKNRETLYYAVPDALVWQAQARSNLDRSVKALRQFELN